MAVFHHAALMSLKRLIDSVDGISHVERDVKEATNSDVWNPPAVLLAKISQATAVHDQLCLIFPVLWMRLHDTGKRWRHVYKALCLVEYLLKTGSDEFVSAIIARIADIQQLGCLLLF